MLLQDWEFQHTVTSMFVSMSVVTLSSEPLIIDD